ncbi:MAG TPA: neutral zinc metallopeptidase [Gemmatimonadaceae bacterium]|nr:neutral zinc metallopeptidase [Gemmatimonadaceae bacterium]
MTRLFSRISGGIRAAALALALGGGVVGMTAAAPRESRPTVTSRDIAASNAKVRAAYDALVAMWSAGFEQLGERFEAPELYRYRGAARTGCGVMGSGNAGYCLRDNAVYFDEVFVAAQAKAAARELGTDGDMSAIGVIAHEMGHAVALQLGYASRFTYDNESTADCLAGAFTRQAGRDGSLEEGDIDEAFYGMSRAGDPDPQLTGDPRVDRRILARASLMGHGTQEQRIQNFRRGLNGGPGACMAALRGLK